MNRRGGDAEAAERRNRAVRLRAAGHPYRSIGRLLGISPIQAHRDVLCGLTALHKELVAETRTLVALELQRLERPMLDIAKALAVETLSNPERCQLLESWRKYSESRRKLLGLDAPAKVAHTDPTGTSSVPPVVVQWDQLYARQEMPDHLEKRIAEAAPSPNGNGQPHTPEAGG